MCDHECAHDRDHECEISMGVRWRRDGRLLCAAMSEAEEGDTYIDGRLLGMLNELRVIVADPNHKKNGLWYWTRDAIILAHPRWKGRGSRASAELYSRVIIRN